MRMERDVRKRANEEKETLKICRLQSSNYIKFEVSTKMKAHIIVFRIFTQCSSVSCYLYLIENSTFMKVVMFLRNVGNYVPDNKVS
jgi:hypothetical protein